MNKVMNAKNSIVRVVVIAFVMLSVIIGTSNVIFAENSESETFVEINGFQMSVTVEGFRTVYSVNNPGETVVEKGLIYGITSNVRDSDMTVTSNSKYVKNYSATEFGKSSKLFSDCKTAESYVMTMQLIKRTDFYTNPIKVRAYIKLADGSYMYSRIIDTSIYKIADTLYQETKMNNASGHDYLFNEILSKVNPTYKPVDYNWGQIIVKPDQTTAAEEVSTEEVTEKEEITTKKEEVTTEFVVQVPDSDKAGGVPVKPTLSHDQWDTDGDYTITSNMWYGNNATYYVLYEKKGKLGTYKAAAQGALNDDTPNAQTFSIHITGKTIPGTYYYYVDIYNKFGKTSSDEINLNVGSKNTSKLILEKIDDDELANQYIMSQGTDIFEIDYSETENPEFSVISSNKSSVKASIVDGNKLKLEASCGGRSGIKLIENKTGEVRYFGVRVREKNGSLAAMPSYLAVGQVSEDSDGDLKFWKSTANDDTNKRMDVRYIYINGGPISGWQSWSGDEPEKRVKSFITESLKLGIVPYFVYYNIPDDAESYDVDMKHVNDKTYMEAYYKDLLFFLETCDKYDCGENVGIILEPDFLGYMMQNSGTTPDRIAAVGVEAVYTLGILKKGVDPDFPNTVKGLVESVNYIISTKYPNAHFGWQFNTWSYSNGVPSAGLMHATETMGFDRGRDFIKNAARETANYYMQAGILAYGADFISIDKYGLDGAYETGAAENPAGSKWLWNSDLWNNYLYYTKSLHETTGFPVTLWQIPVGHLNHSLATNPYTGGLFTDLTNKEQNYEDSAPTYFFGDTFTPGTPERMRYFSTNLWNDSKVSVNGDTITYESHMKETEDAGVTCILFGAGVGSSTDAVGTPPGDDYWWITKAQRYYNSLSNK